ncbi:MAG: hypothetical protein V4734_08495 [Terriglobus sp.]
MTTDLQPFMVFLVDGLPHESLRYPGPEVVRLFEANGFGDNIYALKLCRWHSISPFVLRSDLSGFRWKRVRT